MAGIDPKKQPLTSIQDFAPQKSRGQRRVIFLKKRIEELQLMLDAANAEREEAGRYKETTEKELEGYVVKLALNNTAFRALESRISSIQDEISTVGSEVEALKNEEEALRDGFLSQMYELNAKIRTFEKSLALDFQKVDSSVGTAADLEQKIASLGAELQKRCVCPGCNKQIVEVLSETRQIDLL